MEGFRPIIRNDIPNVYRKLIERCWSQEPEKRPQFNEIVEELRTNSKFITELIDDAKYHDYIEFIDNYMSTFNSSKEIVHFSDFIKEHGRNKNIKQTSFNQKMIYLREKNPNPYKEYNKIVNIIKSGDINSFKDLISNIHEFELKGSIDRNQNYTELIKYPDNDTLPMSNLHLLHISAYFNSLECFKYLHEEKHLPLRSLSKDNFFPLHYACYNGSSEVALYILNEDPEEATLNPEKLNKFHLLFCAVIGNKLDILEELFKNGAKVTDPHNYQNELINKSIEKRNEKILSLIYNNRDPNLPQGKITFAMKAALNLNLKALKIVYRGREDITPYYIDRCCYNSLISLMTLRFINEEFKDMLLKILDDAKDISIEPPEEVGKLCEGVCHWICQFKDLDVAKAMLKTKNVQINRFSENFNTGAFYLTGNKNPITTKLLEILIENGFDVNTRYSDEYPSLLKQFLIAIDKNYDAIEFLIKYGADINALHAREKITLLQFVKKRGDSRLKKIFLQAENDDK